LDEDAFDCALPKGAQVDVIPGTDTAWVKVRLHHKIPGCASEGGWVYRKYLDVEPAAAPAQPVPLPKAKPVPEPKAEAKSGPEKEYVTSARYNLRRDASTRHDPILSLAAGTPLKVISMNGQWVHVTAKGKTGWVAKSGVEIRTPHSDDCPECSIRKPTGNADAKVINDLNNSLREEISDSAPAESCGRKLILAAAKASVKSRWGNKPSSGGLCALGVRLSLQRVKNLGVNGALGNAIDFRGSLRNLGFVDSKIRDPNQAPPGAVIVFEGPRTPVYLRTGYEGPRGHKGNYLGHVTIKGDDGRYYTDGRTAEPSLGW
jgi:uncharacterized protein YgiM (DUF1202 family)